MTRAAGKRILPNTVNQIKTKNKNTKLIFKRENRDLSADTPLKNKTMSKTNGTHDQA